MKVTKKLLNELFKKYSDVVFKQHYGTTGFEYDEEKELNMKNETIIYVLDNVFKIKTI